MTLIIKEDNTVLEIVEQNNNVEVINDSNTLIISEASPVLEIYENVTTVEVITKGVQGPPGPSGTGSIVEIVAAQNIAAFDPVIAAGYIANSNNPAHINEFVGLAQAPILSTFSGNVQTIGEIVNPFWLWSVGDKIFINGSSLSTIAPTIGWVQQIGVAKNPQAIIIDIKTTYKKN